MLFQGLVDGLDEAIDSRSPTDSGNLSPIFPLYIIPLLHAC